MRVALTRRSRLFLGGGKDLLAVKGYKTPTSISFMDKLFGEAATLAVARAYQEATGFHKKHPTLQL